MQIQVQKPSMVLQRVLAVGTHPQVPIESVQTQHSKPQLVPGPMHGAAVHSPQHLRERVLVLVQ